MRQKKEIIPCAYRIQNIVSGKFYIGSTKNFYKRCMEHIKQLRKNIHHNPHLQHSYNKHGEKAFVFGVVEEGIDYIALEQKVLDKINWDNCYNISTSSKGICYRQDMLIYKDKRKGKNHPRWKGGKNLICKCGGKKAHYSKLCVSCRKQNPIENPFKGKHHSEKTRKRWSEIRKGVQNPNKAKKVLVNGVEYPSATEACKALGLTTSAMQWRLSHNHWEVYKGYTYVDGSKPNVHQATINYGTGKEITMRKKSGPRQNKVAA